MFPEVFNICVTSFLFFQILYLFHFLSVPSTPPVPSTFSFILTSVRPTCEFSGSPRVTSDESARQNKPTDDFIPSTPNTFSSCSVDHGISRIRSQ